MALQLQGRNQILALIRIRMWISDHSFPLFFTSRTGYGTTRYTLLARGRQRASLRYCSGIGEGLQCLNKSGCKCVWDVHRPFLHNFLFHIFQLLFNLVKSLSCFLPAITTTNHCKEDTEFFFTVVHASWIMNDVLLIWYIIALLVAVAWKQDAVIMASYIRGSDFILVLSKHRFTNSDIISIRIRYIRVFIWHVTTVSLMFYIWFYI